MKSKPCRYCLLNCFDNIFVRLGHVGDQAFGLAITDLIQELYPHLRVGPASVRTVLIARQGLVSHCDYPEIEG